MESLVQLFCNPGDNVIVPGPCYSVLFIDWWVRCRVSLQMAHTTFENNFEPRVEDLEAAYKKAKSAGSETKILLIM